MNRWSRVRQACQTGELESKDFFEVDSRRRQRRNALADTSAVPLTVPSSSQRLHFHELVERVRELQNEIVPDLKFQSNRTNLSSSLPTNNGALFNYENGRLSICSSGSTTSRSRLSLSSRILERAHQIPERFFLIETILFEYFLLRFLKDFGSIGNKNKCKIKSKNSNRSRIILLQHRTYRWVQ